MHAVHQWRLADHDVGSLGRLHARLESEVLVLEVALLHSLAQYRFDLRDPRFTRDVSGRVYTELLARAAQQLATHEVVVLDAAYNFYEQRVPVYTLAGSRGLWVVGIRCDCPAGDGKSIATATPARRRIFLAPRGPDRPDKSPAGTR